MPEGHPKEGGLLAVLHGSDPQAKAILMLAHVDVVEAKREDWTRDPFTLIEENGYFYGRGTNDMKAQAAIWVDNMIRFREEGLQAEALDQIGAHLRGRDQQRRERCGLACEHERRAIDAEFALTEGADGILTHRASRVALEFSAAEKTSQNFVLERPIPVATAHGRCPTMRSITWCAPSTG